MGTNQLQSLREEAERLKERMRSVQAAAQPEPVVRRPANCLPDCEVCGGLGLVRMDAPVGHEQFGRLAPCPNLPAAARHVPTPSGLYLDELDSLSWSAIRPEPVKAKFRGVTEQITTDLVAAAVRDYLVQPGMVYLFGSWGLGKTRIAKTAVAERVRSGQPGQYVLLSDVLDNIKAGFDQVNPSESAQARLGRFRSHPFLVIDEVDKIPETDFVASVLFRLLNSRYELLEVGQASTILVSNTEPGVLGPALASRIYDGRALVIELAGGDVRLRMTR